MSEKYPAIKALLKEQGDWNINMARSWVTGLQSEFAQLEAENKRYRKVISDLIKQFKQYMDWHPCGYPRSDTKTINIKTNTIAKISKAKTALTKES